MKRGSLAAVPTLALALALALAAPASAQVAVVSPGAPGDDASEGRSAFAELFPDGLPFPFDTVLGQLRAEAGSENVATALIPLGRSSQRMAAHPDFFASPRVLVATTGDWASGPGAPVLEGRLFLAYQRAAKEVLAVSWNETAGRFEFERVANYAGGGLNRVTAAKRAACVACHQGHGPIFARPLWSESAADPRVARTLAPLGQTFEGAPVGANVDRLQAFDAATDQAAGLVLAARLWSEGCTDRRCRAALLSDALRYGLNGRRPDWQPRSGPAVMAFEQEAARLWPAGLAVPSPDLPDRDPVGTFGGLAPGDLTDEILAGDGALDPASPRPAALLWHPEHDGYRGAVRLVAGMLAAGDFLWLDGLLGVVPAPPVERELPCDSEIVEYGETREVRFVCTGAGTHLEGFLAGGGSGIRGRIDRLAIDRSGSVAGVAAAAVEERGALIARFPGASPRLGDGRRLALVRVTRTADGAEAQIELVDDVAPLFENLDALARGDHPAFAPGPVRRGLILDAIERALDPGDG